MTQATTIAEEQAAIAEDFELFDDWREKIEYVLDLGKKLPSTTTRFMAANPKFGSSPRLIVPLASFV